MDDDRLEPPRTKEQLALEVAEALDDLDGFPFYVKVVRKYPEPYIRSALSKALSVPENRIRKSRGALFNWLIRNQDKYPGISQTPETDKSQPFPRFSTPEVRRTFHSMIK